jgi:hypothetical protein
MNHAILHRGATVRPGRNTLPIPLVISAQDTGKAARGYPISMTK